MNKSLTVVTGGSAGIGAALIKILLKDGPVLNISRRPTAISDVSGNYPLYQLNLDLQNTAGACGVFDSWLSGKPELKVSKFFSCAAQLGVADLKDVSEDEFLKTMKLNAWAPIALTEMLLTGDHLCPEGARFVFVTSSLAREDTELSFARLGLYSSSKAALGRLVQIQRREMTLEGRNASSTLVHPGIVDTSMQDILRSDYRSDPAFQEKTANLPNYREGDWQASAPSSKPRTISTQQSADFLSWIAQVPDQTLSEYYDYYACQAFHRCDEKLTSEQSN